MYTLKTYSWGYLLPCFFTYCLLRCCYFSFTSDSHAYHIHPSFSLMTEIKESLQSGAQSSSQILIRYVKASGNSSFTPSYWMQVSPLHQTFCNQYFTRLLKVLWLYRQCTAATSTIHRVLLPLSLKSWKRSEYLKKNYSFHHQASYLILPFNLISLKAHCSFTIDTFILSPPLAYLNSHLNLSY